MVEVSFLISAYNAESTIRQCIESVLLQSFTNFEVILIDDGSNDSTKLIVSSFLDPRIKYFYQHNSGISKALNFGLSKALGKYIAKLDSDDICLPDRILLQYNFLEQNPDYIVCGSNAEIYSIDNHFLYNQIQPQFDEEIRTKIKHQNPFIHSSTFYRREFALKVKYDEVIFHFFEDYLFFSNLINFGKSYNIQESLIRYYVSPFSVSSNKLNSKQLSIRKNILKRGYALKEEYLVFKDLKKINKALNLSNYYLLHFRTFIKKNTHFQLAIKYLFLAIRLRPLNFNIILSILFAISQKLKNIIK